MALRPAVSPVDRLLAGYNLVLAAVWVGAWSRVGFAPWMTAAHVSAAALPWLIEAEQERFSRSSRVLHELYPLLLLAAFWSELGVLRELLHAGAYDAFVAALDRAVFGFHVHEVWLPHMSVAWFSETMHFSYFAYYSLIVIPAIYLLAKGSHAGYRDFTFRLLLSYLVCYVIYLAFPVDGPIYSLPASVGPFTQGLFYRLAHEVVAFGHAKGATFPSSHVAGAVTIAYGAWRWLPRPVAALLSLEALGVCLSTVYTQNHFAIDSLAGIVLALGLQVLVVPRAAAWLQPGVCPSLPVLPAFPTGLGVSHGSSL